MTVAAKPQWVEALEAAEWILREATKSIPLDERASLNALAQTYLGIASEYHKNVR